MKNIKNQKGAISVFVVLAMTFFLVFVLGAYTIASRRSQIQTMTLTELQGAYKENADELVTARYASKSEVIPVYNLEQFKLIGSNEYVEVDGKIYKYGANEENSNDNYSYILKGNIIIDMEEYFSQDLSEIEFFEEKFYSKEYKIDKAEYDLYYYKPSEDGEEKAYWKTILYQNAEKELFTEAEKTSIKEKAVEEEYRYSILNEVGTKYKYGENFEFLLIYNDGLTGNFDIENKYNWWKQSENPVEIVEDILTSTEELPIKVNGYEAVEVKVTDNLWGGLLLSSNSSTILDGATYNEDVSYSVGTISKYDNGTATDETDDGIKGFGVASSRCYLFTRANIGD